MRKAGQTGQGGFKQFICQCNYLGTPPPGAWSFRRRSCHAPSQTAAFTCAPCFWQLQTGLTVDRRVCLYSCTFENHFATSRSAFWRALSRSPPVFHATFHFETPIATHASQPPPPGRNRLEKNNAQTKGDKGDKRSRVSK